MVNGANVIFDVLLQFDEVDYHPDKKSWIFRYSIATVDNFIVLCGGDFVCKYTSSMSAEYVWQLSSTIRFVELPLGIRQGMSGSAARG